MVFPVYLTCNIVFFKATQMSSFYLRHLPENEVSLLLRHEGGRDDAIFPSGQPNPNIRLSTVLKYWTSSKNILLNVKK